MLSCKEATRLVSENLDHKLSFWRRLGLRLHVTICRGCSRYASQITALDRIISGHYADGPPADVSDHIPPDAVRRMKLSIRQAASDANRNNGQ